MNKMNKIYSNILLFSGLGLFLFTFLYDSIFEMNDAMLLLMCLSSIGMLYLSEKVIDKTKLVIKEGDELMFTKGNVRSKYL